MTFYKNTSNIAFNGALPGRTIETDDPKYAKILLDWGFVKIGDETDKKPSKKSV